MLAALAQGCALDRYPQVEVISEPPGARIEVNGDFVGHAPTLFTMLAEHDGEVDLDYTVRAFPAEPEYYPQVKVFLKRAGGDRDYVPKRIYFDMRVRLAADAPADKGPRQRRPWP